jgi:flagellar biosynthesis protein FlhF
VSATSKTTDLEEILRQYEPFRYGSVILTKIDETMRVGNVIGVLAAARKSIAYICDGQGVPLDLEEASVMRLLMNLEGFHVDRERFEKRFGQRRKDLLREARGSERHG